MDLNKAIQSRKSVRRFSTKKPDWRDIIECIDSCRYAPMAGNIFSLKFIVVDDPQIIQKISDASQQDFVETAQYIVVAYSNSSKTKNSYPEFANKFIMQQAGAAIQNFLLNIEEKGLSTCWVGYFVEGQIKRALIIPEDFTIEAIFPIGYESKARGQIAKPRRKIDLDRILYFNKHGNKKMKKIPYLEV